MPALQTAAVQTLLKADGLDGWLLYDFHGSNPIAVDMAGLGGGGHMTTPRWYYLIPAEGEPRGLVHAIEQHNLDRLPGEKRVYAGRDALEAGLTWLLDGVSTVAMEYSPGGAIPYLSRVDAGTAEAIRSRGVHIVSSGDLVQRFVATWSPTQLTSHQRASEALYRIKDRAFTEAFAAVERGERLTEYDLQQRMVGWFAGIVMALQMARALTTYGAESRVGEIVSITLVREMGPVLTSLLVAGRNASGIASELGSMKVTEQIDAMRALGTDPIQKLVTPRLIAIAVMLPLLTVISDFLGLLGGYIIAAFYLSIPASQYWTSAWGTLVARDLAEGLIKPFPFAIIIALVGCFYGLRTSGGTQGVGKATTQAVVVASVWIFLATAAIGSIFINVVK